MVSGEGLVEKSVEEMQAEIEGFLTESERQKVEAEGAMQRSDDLRAESVDCRSLDPQRAEALWVESENLRSEARELMRQSVDKRIKASEIKHQLDIHAQIRAVTSEVDEVWKDSLKARRL